MYLPAPKQHGFIVYEDDVAFIGPDLTLYDFSAAFALVEARAHALRSNPHPWDPSTWVDVNELD